MNTETIYTSKAEKYARYRWDYAALAIQTIFKIARISTNSSVADIGAGTGILTRHFCGKVKQIFAIEPNEEMREEAKKVLFPSSLCLLIDGTAEATSLPEESVDTILVAQAIHWFDPTQTRKEFLRILKPQGWLAILRNYGTNQALNKAIEEISIQDNGVDPLNLTALAKNQPMSFYYGTSVFQRMTFPFKFQQNWEEFIGSLGSSSYAPDEDHSLYGNFREAARRVFCRFSVKDSLEVLGETELNIGQPIEP